MRISREFGVVSRSRRIGAFFNSSMLFPRPRISGPASGDTKANSQIVEIPKMIDVPGRPFRIMQSEATVGLFKQLADAGHEITTHSKGLLSAQLTKGASYDNALTHLNIFDGKALATTFSKHTGRNFRVPTESELEEIRDAKEFESVRKGLSGKNWEWTDTIYKNPDVDPASTFLRSYYILLSMGSPYRVASEPEVSYDNYAVRLVEDV